MPENNTVGSVSGRKLKYKESINPATLVVQWRALVS